MMKYELSTIGNKTQIKTKNDIRFLMSTDILNDLILRYGDEDPVIEVIEYLKSRSDTYNISAEIQNKKYIKKFQFNDFFISSLLKSLFKYNFTSDQIVTALQTIQDEDLFNDVDPNSIDDISERIYKITNEVRNYLSHSHQEYDELVRTYDDGNHVYY